jgi:riboflavin kinase/FMN adenylyltransferase
MLTILSNEHFVITQKLAVAIGTFDGVHKGHREIIHKLRQIAAEKKLGSCILTFEPHPRIVLGKSVELLTTMDEKTAILESFRIDLFVAFPFSGNFSQLTPEEYIREFLFKKMNAGHLMVGYDHRFGKNRCGDVVHLKEMAEKNHVGLTVVDAVMDGEIAISSTRIRNFLKGGNLPEANRLLGYNYILSGYVIHGENRGKKIGFPTANLSVSENKLIPPKGVYACLADVYPNLNAVPSAVNIGINPTFNTKGSVKIEAHLLAENLPDLYGKKLTLHFVRKIRDEVKFSNPDELKQRIREDIEICKDILLK